METLPLRIDDPVVHNVHDGVLFLLTMSSLHPVGILVALALAQAPPLPHVPIDTYPAAMRQALTSIYREAQTHSDDPMAVGTLGRALHAWDQWESAHDAYVRASILAPQTFDWPYLDACVLDRLARPNDVVTRLREAMKLRPDYLPARVRLADALLAIGQIDESRTLFAALVREPEAEPQALFGLGRIAAMEGKHEEAVRNIQQALKLFPEWGAANYSLALSLRALGRREEAEEALQRHGRYGTRWPSVGDPVLAAVSSMRVDTAARLRRAQKLTDGGDVKGAIEEYEGALAADQSLSIAHRALIKLYSSSGNWTKAEEHYRAAVDLGTDLAELHYDYGVLLGLQQKWDDAANAYRRALAINPNYPEARNNLGQILERSRQFEEALAEYRRAVESQPTYRLARFNVGRMLIALNRPDEAIEELQKIVQPRDADAARYLFGLSTAHVRAGHKDEAIRLATDARQLALQHGDVDLAAAIERNLATIR